MRHLKAGRKLGRNATHRRALMRNLARALFLSETGRIITTVEKAKEARRFVERLITLAKKGTLHARRQAIALLGPTSDPSLEENKEGEIIVVDVIKKLFDDIGPRYHDRNGGYTRIIKRHERRLGDAGRTAFLELLKEGETKVRARAATPAPAPAPTVHETPEIKPSGEAPPASPPPS
jgi:large subunit ribosomal protein L17